MQRYNQQQYWNANMRPPAQQQQPLPQHPPPPLQPYYYGGYQQQYWNANMWPPAQQQRQLAHLPPPPRQPYYSYGGGAAANVGGADEARTLYIGSLQNWMDENYLKSCFGPNGELVSAKIILNKQIGQSESYGFLEFSSRTAAENILQSFNDKKMPNAEQSFKLNWAGRSAEDFDIYVENLDAAVTDTFLQETFKSVYPSVKYARVVRDRATGNSMGYGFVRFGDETEKNLSIIEMNDLRILNRLIRTAPAYRKKPLSAQPQTQSASHQNWQGTSEIHVGGLHSDTTHEDLRRAFSQFGDVVRIRILHGQYHGFVRFSNRSSAERALTSGNSIKIRGETVRLSWARAKKRQPGASQSGHSQGYVNTHLGYANYQHHHRQ